MRRRKYSAFETFNALAAANQGRTHHRFAQPRCNCSAAYLVIIQRATHAQVCERFSVTLIVDEAHGAHLGLHAALPPSAMQCGAAVAVQSTHKVLGALTQAAMLHVGHNAPAELAARIASRLRLFQTTSPSYLLMTSLEAAAHEAAAPGAFQQPLEAAKVLRAGMHALKMRVVGASSEPSHEFPTPRATVQNCGDFGAGPVQCDPLRVTALAADWGMTGPELAAGLEQRGVVVELATSRCVVAALGIGSRLEDGERAVAVLQRLRHDPDSTASAARTPVTAAPSSLRGCDGGSHAHGAAQARRRLHPEAPGSCSESGALALVDVHAALLQPTVHVPLWDAAGRTAAVAVSVYPPGAPALIPGETIKRSKLSELQRAVRHGASLVGCSSDLSDIAVCAG